MNRRKRSSSRLFFIIAVLSFAAIVGLGFFRFNASQMEYRLDSIERSIQRYAAEEVELIQVLSGLTSPIKIYSYCKDQLGMSMAKQDIVEIPHLLMAETAAPELQKGWRTSMLAFFGLSVY